MITFTIEGQLPGLNDYINAERTNRFKAAKLKKDVQERIAAAIKAADVPKIEQPIMIGYEWHEKTRRRDKDNIAFAKKFVQDALVESGIIENDGWANIVGFVDDFKLSPEHPCVVVKLLEVDFDV